MTLRIRQLALTIDTQTATFGTSLSFVDGLNVLHAPNSAGKSTCLQAILYALGLEGAVSPRHTQSLPHAVTTKIEDADGHTHSVIKSSVKLEIENHEHHHIVLCRTIIDSDIDNHLVSVLDGPALSQPSATFASSDYFVRLSGSATREAGFHVFLASFLGLTLPDVTKFDGGTVPLYLECLVPYFFVEQKHGWSGTLARLPTYLGIKDMSRRVLEYLLDLDIAKNQIARETLQTEAEQVRKRWHSTAVDASADFRRLQCRLTGVSPTPSLKWPQESPPRLVTIDDGEWIAVDTAIINVEHLHTTITEQTIPTVEEQAEQLETALRSSVKALDEQAIQFRSVDLDIRAQEEELRATDRRLRSLKLDLTRNKDASVLQRLGSEQEFTMSHGECPTCGQAVADNLLDPGAQDPPMSLDDNIAYLESQIKLYRAFETDTRSLLEAKHVRLRTIQEAMSQRRSLIRAQRQSLIADGRQPSVEVVRRQLQLEDRIEQLRAASQQFGILLGELESIAIEYHNNRAKFSALSVGLSQMDRQKIQAFSSKVREQLNQYGFASCSVDDLSISENTYRPVHDGYDIGADVSASDMIRMIWAHLIGLIELCAEYETPHPGLLVLDEPKQQGAAKVSFVALLKRASSAKSRQQQIIFATSEDQADAIEEMRDIADHVIAFKAKILTKISSQS